MDFSDLDKMQDMLAQASQMQEQMDAKLGSTVVEADSGGGMVHVRMSGKKELLRLKIEPTALGSSPADLELLEDLIVAAVNKAARLAEEASQAASASMLGGLNLPGLS